MRQLDPTEFDMSSKRKARNGYDWASFFDGKINLLIRGEDYVCQDGTLIQQLYTNANKLGKVVTVRKYSKEMNGIIIFGVVVQCTGDADKPNVGTLEHKPIKTEVVNQEPTPVVTTEDHSFGLMDQQTQVVNSGVDHAANGPKKGKNKNKK